MHLDKTGRAARMIEVFAHQYALGAGFAIAGAAIPVGTACSHATAAERTCEASITVRWATALTSERRDRLTPFLGPLAA
jgi:hypothetical protein